LRSEQLHPAALKAAASKPAALSDGSKARSLQARVAHADAQRIEHSLDSGQPLHLQQLPRQSRR
jgi:hypothetical protein